MSATAGQTTSLTATATTSEEVILALQRERKNQWESFKKFGEFRNMSKQRGGKLTALGYLYACISAIVFLLYWFVDAVDGRYASLLLLASCFVVRVHPAFNSANGKLKWEEMWWRNLSVCLCSCRCIISSSILRESFCFLHACIENEKKKNNKTVSRFRTRRRVGVCSCVFLMCFAIIALREYLIKLYFLLQRAIQIHADAE